MTQLREIIWNIKSWGGLKCKWINNTGQSRAELKHFQMDWEQKFSLSSLSLQLHPQNVYLADILHGEKQLLVKKMLVITNDTKQVNVHTQSKAIKFSQLQMNHEAPKTQKNAIFAGSTRPFAETRTLSQTSYTETWWDSLTSHRRVTARLIWCLGATTQLDFTLV